MSKVDKINPFNHLFPMNGTIGTSSFIAYITRKTLIPFSFRHYSKGRLQKIRFPK
jgi:hypothetical protein